MTENSGEIIIYNSDDGKISIALRAIDGNVWVTQAQMAELFGTSLPNVSMHVCNILKEGELRENSVIKDFLITASDGKTYSTKIYSLEMILSVGFRVKSKRGIAFRQWANYKLKDYLVKGFILDEVKLRTPGGFDYFDELLQKIREIRSSEFRFYQKVRDLFSLSEDYDSSDKATQMFFAAVQNKLIYAVTGRTAAELIVERADSSKANMGLTNWKGNIARKGDILTAKNYLTRDELDTLDRLVSMFLDAAELRVKDGRRLVMKFWEEQTDKLIAFAEYPILKGNGTISHEKMKEIADARFSEFDEARKHSALLVRDAEEIAELEALEKKSVKKKK
jgi:Virulence protein